MAAVPTTTMMARIATGGGQQADLGPDLSADGGADGDEDDGCPVEVGDEEEEDRGDGVHDRGEDVLDGVEALQGVVEQHAHEGEVDDPLGGGEVPAVDAGEQQADEEQRAAVGAGGLLLAHPAFLDGLGDPGLQDDQTSARATRTGTIVSKAVDGRTCSRTAPVSPPTSAAAPRRRMRGRWPVSSAR